MNGHPDLNESLQRIGVAASTEHSLDCLLELIVEEARNLTRADGGTLYLVSDRVLEFKVIQSKSLKLHSGGATGTPVTWAPIPLYTIDDKPNFALVAARTALTGETINIPDVYKSSGYDFRGTQAFDMRTRYLSRSLLVVPMRDHEGTIIGVLQLLNAKDPAGRAVIPFDESYEPLVESLASKAAAAIADVRFMNKLEQPGGNHDADPSQSR